MKKRKVTNTSKQSHITDETDKDSTDLNNENEDSTNFGHDDTNPDTSVYVESDADDQTNVEELENQSEQELNSDPYPDLVDELSGIIYISRIPPFMGLGKLRSYFSNFGKIGKVYAHPEPIGQYRKRVKLGGNKKLKFTHAWIQFYDKKVAKKVAKLLNNQPFSDTKSNSYWKYDLWNIKYLPKFKWHHLVEYWSEHKRESKEQLSLLLQKERKKNLRYLEQLEIEKREHQIELKKSSTSRTTNDTSNETHDVNTIDGNKTLSKRPTHSRKRKKINPNGPVNKEIPINLLNSIAL